MTSYYMPTKVIWGKECIKVNGPLLKKLGNKALLVTGKQSAKVSGALDDVIHVLDQENITFHIYDGIEENPTVENVVAGANSYPEADFVIGIGGGSPIDAAKTIASLLKNKGLEPRVCFWSGIVRESLPVVAVPTTAGTGSEVTQYAVLTDHVEQTKKNFEQNIFPVLAFLRS